MIVYFKFMQISRENSISNSNMPIHPRLTAGDWTVWSSRPSPICIQDGFEVNAKQPITSSENTLACISKSKNYFILLF